MKKKKWRKKKESLEKKCQQQRDPTLKTTLNKLTKELAGTIKDLDNISINKYLSELSKVGNSNYWLWKCTEQLQRPIQRIPAIKMPNQQWAKTDKQKANVFSEHLLDTFSVKSQNNNLNLTEISAINDADATSPT